MATISTEGHRDDTIKKVKEESYAREAESSRKHKSELRNLTQEYENEVESLKKNQSDQIEQMNDYIKNRLTKQEVEHQRQSQDLRDLYAQQLKKKSEESSYLLSSEKDIYKDSIEKDKVQHEAEKKRIEKQFEIESLKKDQGLKNYSMASKDENSKVWEERRLKLDDQKKKAIEEERKGLNHVIENLNNKLMDVRKTDNGELKRVQTQNDFEKQRLLTNYKQNIDNQEKLNSMVHHAMTEDFQSEQALEKQKFKQKIADNQDKIIKVEGEIRENLTDRVNNQFTTLKNEIVDTKNQKIVEQQNLVRKTNTEKKHIINAYEQQLQDEQKKIDQIQSSASKTIEKELGKAVTTRDRAIKTITEENNKERNLAKLQNSAQMSQMKTEMEERDVHLSKRAESRVNIANEHLKQNTSRLQKFYTDTLELIKEGFEEKLNTERERHVEERAELENKLGTKFREQEKLLTHQMESNSLAFDDQIHSVKDFYETELRRSEIEHAKQLNDREKAYKVASQNDNIRFENQINQIKELHSKEIEDLDRRHKHELNELVQKTADRLHKKV